MKNLFFSSIALLFMASCGIDEVNFLSPQPEFVDALTEIPNEYHGEFRIDGDTHIVTMSTIDGINIIDDSVVVKRRGSYFYINRINKKGFYNLVILRRVNFLNHESISLYIPQFNVSYQDIFLKASETVDSLSTEETQYLREEVINEYVKRLLDHYELFNVTGGLSPFYDLEYEGDIVLEDVTVNQLSILTSSSKKYNVERLK